ncbi:DUF4430 domain-containing protein [Halalkalibacter hemicellulosilyticus]|uniref:Transcobalamin-like C-terminal domain-containing protein n=1 Tax=Halalkalibacter hemicellulosilyticusJCM 9152 TaxID=1236971 RepID=W4QHD9_9BACI|nr:DUF4430 domain-containing protein [Halalkalibacter hemicellulosilyticus]GAE31068.1 hypothetical protein JCM9152_2507 [Halalkalibacter hemicellulosilyticusJCM 9152]
MRIRWFQILLLMFMTIGILVGCGTGNKEELQDDQEQVIEDVEVEQSENAELGDEESNAEEEVEQLEDAEVVLPSKSGESEQSESTASSSNEDRVDESTEKKESSQTSDRQSSSNEKKEQSSSNSHSNSSNNQTSNSKQKEEKKQESSSSKSNDSKAKEEKTPSSPEPTVTIVIQGPSDKGKIGEGQVAYADGDTVLDILTKYGKSASIHVDSTGRGAAAYVQGIANIYEFDYGPRSGWVAKVNGTSISQSAGVTAVKEGDRVEWLYTEE